MLYPKRTKTRELMNINGIWNFKVDYKEEGEKANWYSKKLSHSNLMPVPSSYNDITVDKKVRDFVGSVWYQTTEIIPEYWKNKKTIIRIGSASHNSKVWINGIFVKEYIGGFLPYEKDITKYINCGEENLITIKVNNELTWQTLPPGETYYIDDFKGGKIKKLKQQHDFFNYSGIHRSVYLYTKPRYSIEDITIETDYKDSIGKVKYKIDHNISKNKINKYKINGSLYKENKLIGSIIGDSGEILVPDVQLWKPGDPSLYKFVSRISDNSEIIDEYELDIGIRTIKVDNHQFKINDEPFYFKGFGKHEDMDIKGKGLDDAVNIRDYNLLKWINANSYRTSHYPYSEEMLDLADKYGIVVIGEVPAVGMLGQSVPAIGELDGVFTKNKVNDKTLKEHIRISKEMIKRDKNHPSIVMWSLANEASVMEPAAEKYFEELTSEVRKIDKRPLLNVNLMLIEPGKCNVSKLFDVIGLNLYFGWYSEEGEIEIGANRLRKWLTEWYKFENKPILMAEYGVDTISGLHKLPSIMFSEEYQIEFLKAYHTVFDELDFVIGEHVWNFADFMTEEGTVRIDGNKKGVFTRQRQPKMVAHYLKNRWDSR